MITATAKSPSTRPVEAELEATLAWLKRRGTKANREGMARYAIRAEKVFGVSVTTLRQRAKTLGRNHELASALWDTGWYEARMLAAFVDDPACVTPAQLDRWCKDFDNWAICDTACFHLFDRTPHAFKKVAAWSRRKDEFDKRAASAASPDKTARWIGKDAVRQLGSPAVARRLAARAAKEKA